MGSGDHRSLKLVTCLLTALTATNKCQFHKNALFGKQSKAQSGSRDREFLRDCVMRLEADRGPEDGRQRLEAPARLRLAMRP